MKDVKILCCSNLTFGRDIIQPSHSTLFRLLTSYLSNTFDLNRGEIIFRPVRYQTTTMGRIRPRDGDDDGGQSQME